MENSTARAPNRTVTVKTSIADSLPHRHDTKCRNPTGADQREPGPKKNRDAARTSLYAAPRRNL